MIVNRNFADRFIHEYKRFLLSIYEPEEPGKEPVRMVEKLVSARRRFMSNRELFTEYMNKREDDPEPLDRKIMLAIRNVDVARWVYLRDMKSYSIFINADSGYGRGVLGLTDEIRVLTKGVGVALETGVISIDDRFVCDGLIVSLIHLGPNYRRSFNDLYREMRQSGKFLTNPLLSQTVSLEATKPRRTPKK